MPSTANRGLPYPAESDAPDGPVQIQALANALDIIMLHGTAASIPAASSHARCLYYTTDTAGLFYSNGTTWKPVLPTALSVVTAMIADLNVTTAKLADLGVTTGKLADLAVTEAKTADAAITSRKFKPTAGVVKGTGGGVTYNNTPADIAGMSLSVTPAVASVLIVTAHVLFNIGQNDTGNIRLTLDGTVVGATDTAGVGPGPTVTSLSLICSRAWQVSLTAAAHTVKVQGWGINSSTGAQITGANCTLSYLLVAA